MRQYVYELEKEIAQSIGFVVPKNNVRITREKRDWAYNPRTKFIHTANPRVVKLENNKAAIDFAIAHEFAHLVQDFILRNRIAYSKLTFEKYEKALRKFFKDKKISVSYVQFYKFKNFINGSVFNNKDIVKVMSFDEKYYVAGTQITECPFGSFDALIPLYTENTIEVTANTFAATYVHEKYKAEKQPKELLLALSKIVNEQLQALQGASRPRSKKRFMKQIHISKFGKDNSFFDALLQTINPETNYKSYNFTKTARIMTKCIKEMKSIILQTQTTCR